MQPLALSVLDFPRRLEDTLRIARVADEHGYRRFWVAEHAPQPNPILIASFVAQATRRIRTGTAGILFHSYSPVRVAYDYQLLEQRFEGRIDAGFCGGWFPDELVDDYLDGRPRACKTDGADYQRRVRKFVGTLRGGPGTVPWRHGDGACPQIWSLGTGERSASLAADCGISFAYSLFHRASGQSPQVVEEYRRRFREQHPELRAEGIAAVAVACGADDAKARQIAERSDLSAVIPSVIGEARRCAEELRLIAERYRTEEIVVLNLAGNVQERGRSFSELAHACDLS